MEILIQLAVSAICLIILVSLLPVRWSLFGKGVIWFTSSLVAGLFILTWEYQPKIQTILLYIALTLSMSVFILKWWGDHFNKKPDRHQEQVSDSLQPLFSYQKQLETAKLAKPADLVKPDFSAASVNVNNNQPSLQAEGRSEQVEYKAYGNVTEDELKFLLTEGNHEMPSFLQDETIVEDEPGDLFDDWMISDGNHFDTEFESSFSGRAMLLNDGIANLYKEQAESVKKLKAKAEDVQPVLQE